MIKSQKWTKKFKNWLEIKQFLTNFKLLVLFLSLLRLKKQLAEQIFWISKLNNICIHLILHNYLEKKLIFKKLLNQLILFGKIDITHLDKEPKREYVFGLSSFLCWRFLLELFLHAKKLVTSTRTGMAKKIVPIIMKNIQKMEKVKKNLITKLIKHFMILLKEKTSLFANN